MASVVTAILRYFIVGTGLFAGFYFYFSRNIPTAIALVTLSCAGLVGILSFFSHVVFHKSVASKLGVDSDQNFFQFEVGFANLAIGLMALVVYFVPLETIPQITIFGCYSLYLLQALILHIWRYVTGAHRTAAYLWLSIVLSAVYIGMMLFFAIAGITSNAK